MTLSRRQFGFAAFTTVAFSGMSRWAQAPRRHALSLTRSPGYGPLQPMPAGCSTCRRAFPISVVSRAGDVMDDGFHAPGNFDGMGCFAAGPGKVALVRNHELTPERGRLEPFRHQGSAAALQKPPYHSCRISGAAADGRVAAGRHLDPDRRSGKRPPRSPVSFLTGTATNCAGGITPWGSWLTCEEAANLAAPDSTQSHGWVFECRRPIAAWLRRSR